MVFDFQMSPHGSIGNSVPVSSYCWLVLDQPSAESISGLMLEIFGWFLISYHQKAVLEKLRISCGSIQVGSSEIFGLLSISFHEKAVRPPAVTG
ncbi:hypothetical protein AAHA92_20614 [Salvia divinorum]|uniref:Uncharacterized protein n=1 Tax=Salvia divinorum TaxID=28513 RepID=A0ABD1GHS6_SALDI